MVTHRLTTVVDCDLITPVEGGRIAGIETHRQFLARNGLYPRLAQRQFLVKATPRSLSHTVPSQVREWVRWGVR